MLKNSKRGFTLVELLAVIVILAVILAIAVPSISGLMTNTKKSAFQDNVKLIIKGIDYKVLEAQAAGTAGPAADGATDVKATLDDYGANPVDYASFFIETVSPTTITITGVTGGKFGTCTVTDASMTNMPATGSAGDPGVVTGC